MTLGNLVVNLTANTSKFTAGMQKSRGVVASFSRSAQRWISGVAASLSATVAAWVSYSTAIQAVQKATEQFASERKLEAVLKSTGSKLLPEAITNFAKARQEVTNFGDEATISAAAVLATFKSIGPELFFPTLEIMQDMSAVLGQDMQSSAIQLGKALENPAIGLTALRRVGVSFTESQVELIKSLQGSGRLLEAQEVILAEIRSQFGGASEATADLITQLGGIRGDALEGLGKVLINVANTLDQRFDIKGMATDFAAWTNSIADNESAISKLSDSVGKYITSLRELKQLLSGDVFGATTAQAAKLAMEFNRIINPLETLIKVIHELNEQLGLNEKAQRKLIPAGPQRPPVPNANVPQPAVAPGANLLIGNRNRIALPNGGDWLANMMAAGPGAKNRGFTSANPLANISKPAIQRSVSRDFAPAAEKGSAEAYRMIIRAQKPDEQLRVMNKIEENTRQPALINSGRESKTIESFK